MRSYEVVSIRVHAVSLVDAVAYVERLAESNAHAYVCAANVHMAMEACDDGSFQDIVNSADLVVPDGAPLAWALRGLGAQTSERVRGPDLMLALCESAMRRGLSIGLFGSTRETLEALVDRLRSRFPTLGIAFAIAPGALSTTESLRIDARTAGTLSSADLLFVGLGCPKQEKWMAANRDSVAAPMIGVGAAFDMHAGRMSVAPAVLQKLGLEWLFRLALEPRRLWKRYAVHNPRFVALLLRQFVLGRPSCGMYRGRAPSDE